MTIAGSIGGAGGLTKIGSGMLTLSNNNTFTGLTTISGCTLQLTNQNAVQESTLNSTGSGVLNFGALTAATFGGLSGSNALTLSNSAAAGVSLSVGNNGTNTTFSGNLTGTGGLLIKVGAGRLTLTGTNSYGGGTTISGGALVFSTPAAFLASPAKGNLILAGGFVAATGPYSTVNGWLNSGLIAASPASGGIALTASSNENFNFATAGLGSNFGTYANLALGSVGAATYGGTFTPVNAIYQFGGGGGTLTLAQPMTGNNSLVAFGSGGGASGMLVLASISNYTGNTTISGGTLQQGVAGAIPTGPGYGNVILNGGATVAGTLDLDGINMTVNGLSGSSSTVLGQVINSSGTNTLTIGNANASSTFAGQFTNGAGVLALTKTGSGQIVLAGASTYTGGTIVSGGTLVLASNGVKTLPANATATVNAGGVLAIVGTTTGTTPTNISNTIDVNSGGTLLLNLTGTGALQDQEGYIGTVNLDSSLGTGALVTSPNGSGLRMGYNGSSFLNSTGSMANTWAAELRLTYKSGDTATINTGTGNMLIISGVIDEYPGLTGTPLFVTGGGTLALTAANTYAGPTTISGGTVLAAGNSPLGTGSVTLSPSSAATLLFNGAAPAIGSLSSGTAGGTSSILLGDAVGNNPTLLTVNNTTATTFDGAIGDLSNTAANAVGSLVKTGTGTLTLGGSNSYTGSTTIAGGALQLDFSQAGAPAANILPAGTGLVVTGNGALQIAAAASGTNSQALGGITRTPGGVINFVVPATASISTTSGTASTLLTDGYGVAYATVVGTDWAAKDANNVNIVAGSTITGFYTPSTTTTLSGNADVASGVNTTLSSNTVVSSLRVNQNQATTIAIGSSNTLTTGGILVTPAVATAGSTISGGTLQAPVGGDLVVVQNSGQPFTISATIADNGGSTSLTKSGSGNLVLGGTNTYTGNTSIDGGTLTLANANALAASTLNYNGLGGSLSFGTLTSASIGGLSGGRNLPLLNGSSAGVALTVGANNQSTTYSGVLSGSGGLTVTGNGMLTLGGNNTYSGGTTLAGGTVNFTTLSNLGATANSPVTFQNGGTLLYSGTANAGPDTGNPNVNFAGNGTICVSNSSVYLYFYSYFTGNGMLTKTGPGELALESSGSGASQPVVIAQGTLMETSSRLGNATSMTVQNGGQWEFWASGSYNYSLATGANVYLNGSGPNGTGGALLYAPQTAAYSETLNNNVVLQSTSSIVVGVVNTSVGTLTLTGNISGSGGLIKDYSSGLPAGRQGEAADFTSSQGILALSGTDSYTGNTWINSGKLLLASSAALPATTTLYIDALNSSTLDLSGYNAMIAALNNGPNGGGTITNSGTSGTATLIITGSGYFGGVLQNGATASTALAMIGTGMLTLTGSNTYSGGTTISGGTLVATGNSPLGTGNLTFSPSSAATLLLNGSAPAIASLSSSGTGTSLILLGNAVGNNATVLTVNNTTATMFDGAIGDQSAMASAAVGSLVKTGSGTLTLGGSNTYTGSTTISGGALQLDFSQPGAPAANILGSTSPVTLTNGALLTVLGAANIANSQSLAALNVNMGAMAFQGVSRSGGTLTVALGNINRNPGGIIDFTLPASGIISTTSGSAASLLTDANGVAYATVAGSDWAAKDANNVNIVAGSTINGFYTLSTAGTLSGNADVASGINTTLNSNTVVSGLRFNQNQATAITIGGGNTLTTGGILVTPAVATAGANLTGGTLQAPAGGDLVVVQNGSQGFTISSTIANNGGSTALNKSGPGNLVLGGANTYSGNTSIWNGTLTLANSNALAGSTLIYNNLGGALSFGTLTSASLGGLSGGQNMALTNTSSAAVALSVGGNGQNTTYSGVLSGSGGLSVIGNGMIMLTGNNTYSGNATISGGTLSFSSLANLGASGGAGSSSYITFQNGGTLLYTGTVASLNYGTAHPLIFSGNGTIDVSNSTANLSFVPVNFSGTGTMTMTGPGEMQYGTTGNGQSGAIVVAQGTFMQTSPHTSYISGMTVQNGGQYEIFDDQDEDIGQGANFSMASMATITLNGKGPVAPVGTVGSLGALLYTPQSTNTHGVALITNNIVLQTDSSIVVANSSTDIYKLRLNGNISGSGSLIKDYVNALPAGRAGEMDAGLFTNSMGILALGGNNSYGGNTTINAGTILLQSPSALPAATTLYIDSLHGSTLDLGGYNATVAGLNNGPDGGGTIVNSGTANNATLTVSSSGLFGGSIQDGGSKTTALWKSGSGADPDKLEHLQRRHDD